MHKIVVVVAIFGCIFSPFFFGSKYLPYTLSIPTLPLLLSLV